MNRWPLTALLLVLAAPVAAQVAPEQCESTFTVADGLEFKLWASEPLFANPTCIDVDHRGRVWVCEAVNYRTKLHGKPLNRPAGDRIVILEDTKGTGRADKATTFYQAPDLHAPLGIAVAKDPTGPGWKVFVCQSPDILVFEDKDGDGKADGPPRKLLSGFGGVDNDHGVHGISIGPDMRLYFSVGDQGVRGLQSSDGQGRKWKSNDTDCRAGTIWRCDLDGRNLELIAHNFRNEYEPCVDSFGTVFVSDNDDDGSQQTRICYVMPGGDYGYHPRGKGESHWHEEQPGVVPKILRTWFGSPTGMCVYEGTLLPKKYWGQLLHTDAGPRHVRCYRLKPRGAGYDVERDDLVTSTDNWFRPSDVCVAPDGSVFVADWYDPGVGGHGMGDTTRGRVFRLAPKGNTPAVPKVDLETSQGFLAALASPNLAVRYMAMAAVHEMKLRHTRGGPPEAPFKNPLDGTEREIVAALARAAEKQDHSPLRARALWLCMFLDTLPSIPALQGPTRHAWMIGERHTPDAKEVILLLRLMKEYTYSWKKAAAGDSKWKEGSQLLKLLADKSSTLERQVLVLTARPAGRRELLLSLRDVDPATAAPWVLEAAKLYDGKDRFYLEALGIAVGRHDKKRREIILADFEKHFPEWNDKVADLVWELQPPSVMATLGRRLTDPKLTGDQRARVVDILAVSNDPAAGKTVLAELLKPDVPAAVRGKAVENLKRYLPGKWSGLRKGRELGDAVDALLAKGETREAGLELVAAAEREESAGAVAKLAGAAGELPAVRKAAVQTLGALPSEAAVKALAGLLGDGAVAAESLEALGKQAAKRKNPGEKPALEALQGVVTGPGRPAPLRRAALSALAGTRPGTAWLLETNEQGRLDPALKEETARLLRNSPYQDLRNKAMVAFPPPGRLDPKKLPPPSALAARRGDAGRGKKLLAASLKNDLQCLKCHPALGAGGNVGPDLSAIGKKASRENLFESILYPSRAIADQYVTWQVETKKGTTVSGLLIEETADFLTLRDGNGKDTKLAKADVESRTKSPKSLMPDDLLVYMTEEELVDLVEYLLTLRSQALTLDWWHAAGPFAGGAGAAAAERSILAEKRPDPGATHPGERGPVSWRVVRPGADGAVDLSAGDPGSVSYLAREVESPADQEATIVLGPAGTPKVWVCDELALTAPDPTAAPDRYAVKARLRKGVNRILVRLENGTGTHGFTFTLLAEQEVKRVEAK